jgi:hypothetical protein
MRSRYLIHYDADGGGFGAFLLSYVGANLLADALDYELVTVNPLIRSTFELDKAPSIDRILSTANVLRLDDIISSFGKHEISFKQLSFILKQNKCDCLIYGRHHLPRIAVADFIQVIAFSSYAKYASSRLSALRLVSSLQNDYVNLATSNLGVHIRTFFDSKSGNDDFRRHRSLFYGFVLELIKSHFRQERLCYLACDDANEWQVAKQIFAINGLGTINSFGSVKHSSLAHFFGTRLLYANRSVNDDISLVVEQSNFGELDSLRKHLRPTLLDWMCLGKSNTILCTNTSFAVTAALFFSSRLITFPCRSDLKSLSTPLTLV